ncbi:MAG TPA: ribosome recycling factor [bacterium]|nr:ribosome recycling factor [bacterium]
MADANAILNEAESKMKKAIEATKRDFAGVRTGRASTALVENVKVEYYGSLVPLNQVANVSTPDSRTIEIKPWDANALMEIEKALQKSDLGIAPNNDGKIIRLSIPPLTEERRKEFVKLVHKFAEGGRVAIRSIRQDSNKSLDHMKKEIAEDEFKKFHDRIQKMTDLNTQEINKLSEHKEKEILEF